TELFSARGDRRRRCKADYRAGRLARPGSLDPSDGSGRSCRGRHWSGAGGARRNIEADATQYCRTGEVAGGKRGGSPSRDKCTQCSHGPGAVWSGRSSGNHLCGVPDMNQNPKATALLVIVLGPSLRLNESSLNEEM